MIKKGPKEEKPSIEGHPRKLWEGLCKKKEEEKRNKKREGECFSILRRAKEVSIEERHNKCQK